MNRREFVGTMAGSIAAAKLSGGLAGFAQESATASTPQGAWIDNGIIDAGGSHEPYIFVVRSVDSLKPAEVWSPPNRPGATMNGDGPDQSRDSMI